MVLIVLLMLTMALMAKVHAVWLAAKLLSFQTDLDRQ